MHDNSAIVAYLRCSSLTLIVSVGGTPAAGLPTAALPWGQELWHLAPVWQPQGASDFTLWIQMRSPRSSTWRFQARTLIPLFSSNSTGRLAGTNTHNMYKVHGQQSNDCFRRNGTHVCINILYFWLSLSHWSFCLSTPAFTPHSQADRLDGPIMLYMRCFKTLKDIKDVVRRCQMYCRRIHVPRRFCRPAMTPGVPQHQHQRGRGTALPGGMMGPEFRGFVFFKASNNLNWHRSYQVFNLCLLSQKDI